MTLEVVQNPWAITIRVAGRLDGVSAPELQGVCAHWIGGQTTTIVLDLSGLDYVSSAGLGAILSAGKALFSRGGQLVISGLAGRIEGVFKITGLLGLFPVFDSPAAAQAYCQGIGKTN